MAYKKIPPSDVSPLTKDANGNWVWTADYYDFFKCIDALDALSQINFPAAVSSIGGVSGAVTLASGLSMVGQKLTPAATSLSSLSSAMIADVALNNTANYFDGPAIAQGSAGTWFVHGTVTVIDTAATAAVYCKLWDGTTVIASSAGYSSNATRGVSVSLCGIITSPVGNLKISCRDPDAATGKILFNATGNSKDSNISAVRIV